MKSLEMMHQKAAKVYEERNLDEALKIYNEIVALNPADDVALSCIMDIYLEKNDKFNYYLSRANVNIAQNKLEYAIKDTKKALEIDMDSIEARRKLARLYRVDNKNLKAIDEFLNIIKMDEKQLDAYFELADLYIKEDSLDSAISIASKGYEIFPDNADMANMLAKLYFKANDNKKALEVVEDDLLKIKILLEDNQNDKAMEELSKIKIDFENQLQKRSYHLLKAQYYYNKAQYDNSLNEIDNYVKLGAPDAVSFQMKALIYEELNDEFNAHFNWGFCYKFQSKFDEAIVEFDAANKQKPDDKSTLIELANLYQKNKEKYVAMEYWQKVYNIDKDENARQILAEFYYSEGNFEKAEQYGKVIEKKQKEEENYTGFLDKIMSFFGK